MDSLLSLLSTGIFLSIACSKDKFGVFYVKIYGFVSGCALKQIHQAHGMRFPSYYLRVGLLKINFTDKVSGVW
jgi:hypothetical protein